MITNQAYTFIIFVIVGICIGVLFDFFRILRKAFNTKDFITYIEDILFCILTGIILLYSIFKFNSGEIRLYIFIGLLFGVIIYMLSISKFFVKINLFVIEKIKQIFKPISFVIINVRKILSKISLKMEYLKKNKQINKKMS